MQQVNLIKIGSDSFNEKNVERLVYDIDQLRENTGEESIVISSGAVSKAKEHLGNLEIPKASFASAGQVMLMNTYQKYTHRTVAQGLLSDHVNRDYIKSCMDNIGIRDRFRHITANFAEKVLDLHHAREDHNLLNVIQGNFVGKFLTILNHNDTMSSVELSHVSDKTDNDRNVVYVSRTLDKYRKEFNFNIKRVIFLTNTNGLLDKQNTVNGGEIELEFLHDYITQYMTYIISGVGKSGTGGMESKVLCALNCLQYGINEAIIANAKGGLDCLINKEDSTTFTVKKQYKQTVA